MNVIKTKRLLLRPWKKDDFEPFAKRNADPRVMEFFPKLLTRSESDHFAQKAADQIEEKGWGFWAVTAINVAPFIGLIGIEKVSFIAPFTPAVEIGVLLTHFGNKGMQK